MNVYGIDIENEHPKLAGIINQLIMSKEQAQELTRLLQTSMNNKLDGKKATVKMINTHVHELPNRKQNGTSYGVDLGGSNLRVLAVEFTNGKMTKHIEYEAIDESILKGNADELFDLIAMVLERCSRHYQKEGVADLKTVGFTFSFPVDQISLTSGTLMHWTKGFDTKNVVGKDVALLLKQAIDKRPNIECDDVGLLNDTVGTLLCGAQKYDGVCIGFIMGTGCNACYIDKTVRFSPTPPTTVNGDISHINGYFHEHVIVNTEYGGFGSDGGIDHLRNDYEIKIDADSIRPGEQVYEKMLSGLYIVDTYKLILKDIQALGYTVNMDIESITGKTLSALAEKADTFVNGAILEDENAVALLLAKLVCERVALLAAAGLSALIKHMGKKKAVIATDGSVIQKNHFIRGSIEKYLNALLPDCEISIVTVTDGSGSGAAILASTFT